MDVTSSKTVIGVAIMGYGVVGQGAAYAIQHNSAQIEKKTGLKLRLLHILDLLDFDDSPDAALITHSVVDIMDDDNVDVVVETMGGLNAAYDFTKEALKRQKHVITSNKELVAEHGLELLELAHSHNVSYRFDASVGGGIPVISPIRECLAANRINEISGILNGTTNYMITYMRTRGTKFSETLKMAQAEGYAEKDTSADIGGADACRKLAILSSIAWDAFLDWKDIHTEGISTLNLEDVSRAVELGRTLKLYARACLQADGRVEAYVIPAMLDRQNPLSNVSGVNNAVMVNGDLSGSVMLYGEGAGKLPTGSAIVSDIIKAAGCSGINANPCWSKSMALEVIDFSTYVHSYYVRVTTPVPDAFCIELFKEFPAAQILPRNGAVSSNGDSCAFTVTGIKEGVFADQLARVISKSKGATIGFVARLL